MRFSMFKRLWSNRGANETTTSTIEEMIPTIVASALLEMQEGEVVRPLVTNIPFPGPGIIHQTPFVTILTSEADDSLSNQAIDTSGSAETSPSAATVGVHGATVMVKEIAELGAVDNVAAMAGRLIGQCVTLRREQDLVALFSAWTNQGSANVDITPGDLYDAYASLRTAIAPLPYFLVMHPGNIWSSVGLISLFDNSSDAIQTRGPGTVGEEWARTGFAGMALGFQLYATAAITVTSNNASGAAFSREAIKFVSKRPFRIDVLPDVKEVGLQISGTEMWGEATLRGTFGNEMQFNQQA